MDIASCRPSLTGSRVRRRGPDRVPRTAGGGRCVEVDVVEGQVNLRGSLDSREVGALDSPAGRTETTKGARIVREGFRVPLLEPLRVMRDETVVEVLTTQVAVSGGILDLNIPSSTSRERHIEDSTADIEHEDVPLTGGLLFKILGHDWSSRLADDTENVKAASVLDDLKLGVGEVRGDGDSGRGYGTAGVGPPSSW